MSTIKRYFSKEDLKKLAQAVADAEKNTSGQIRVVARHSRHWKERKLSLRDLALREFYRLGVQNTGHHTGVLLLVLFSERKFEIVADEGIHTRVTEGTWERIAAGMSIHFRKENYVEGISEAVKTIGNELAKYFPRDPESTNELPDEIVEE
ncbi:MAG TPA: TPM domain-containing protein [Bacteroidota bacterium]|nr:TPM domain-containing protein [Bacteroidota bacterium]